MAEPIGRRGACGHSRRLVGADGVCLVCRWASQQRALRLEQLEARLMVQGRQTVFFPSPELLRREWFR